MDTDHNSTLEQQMLQEVIGLPAGTEMVMPGDNVSMTIELITPIAIEKRTSRFAISRRWKNSWFRSCLQISIA